MVGTRARRRSRRLRRRTAPALRRASSVACSGACLMRNWRDTGAKTWFRAREASIRFHADPARHPRACLRRCAAAFRRRGGRPTRAAGRRPAAAWKTVARRGPPARGGPRPGGTRPAFGRRRSVADGGRFDRDRHGRRARRPTGVHFRRCACHVRRSACGNRRSIGARVLRASLATPACRPASARTRSSAVRRGRSLRRRVPGTAALRRFLRVPTRRIR